jgi:hypothetical protein
MTQHWKVEVFHMVKIPIKHMESYKKQILDSFELDELNPKYNEVEAKVRQHWNDNADFVIHAISTQAKNSTLFEL